MNEDYIKTLAVAHSDNAHTDLETGLVDPDGHWAMLGCPICNGLVGSIVAHTVCYGEFRERWFLTPDNVREMKFDIGDPLSQLDQFAEVRVVNGDDDADTRDVVWLTFYNDKGEYLFQITEDEMNGGTT